MKKLFAFSIALTFALLVTPLALASNPDAQFVRKQGDTMSGTLKLPKLQFKDGTSMTTASSGGTSSSGWTADGGATGTSLRAEIGTTGAQQIVIKAPSPDSANYSGVYSRSPNGIGQAVWLSQNDGGTVQITPALIGPGEAQQIVVGGLAGTSCSGFSGTGNVCLQSGGLKFANAGRGIIFSDGTTLTTAPASSSDRVFAAFTTSVTCSSSTCALLAGSKNVSSVQRGAVGGYVVNFSTNYATTPQYFIACQAFQTGGGAARHVQIQSLGQAQMYFATVDSTGAQQDASFSCVLFKDYSAYP